MCTLIVGRNVLGADTVLLGANRDEDPARPTDPPGVLMERPLVAGGRDRLAGGTWLALREGRAAVAVLNRHDPDVAPGERRSRGLLALDVAAAVEAFDPLPGRRTARTSLGGERGESPDRAAGANSPGPAVGGDAPGATQALDRAARAALERALARDRYGPFTLVLAAPDACWLATSAREPAHEPEPIPAGWHVLTHRDLDDPSEPRAVHLLRALRDFRPRSLAEAEARLIGLLRSHAGPGAPAVCIHEGRMQTVSSSLVWLDPAGARYRHAEGRPCEREFADQAALLAG
jgi:hypothetical protein